MVESKVDFDNMPSWASNYMKSIGVINLNLVEFLKMIRIKMRAEAIDSFISQGHLVPQVKNQLYFDNEGNLFFTWRSEGERDMFIVKWSTV